MTTKRRKTGSVEDGAKLYDTLFGRSNAKDDQDDDTVAGDETGNERGSIEAGRNLYRTLHGRLTTDVRPGARSHGTDPFGPPAA